MFIKIKLLMLNVPLLAILISLLTFTVTLAASGDLDTSFSGDGMVITDFVPSSPGRADILYNVAVQSNGKIVAVGYSYTLPPELLPDFAVSRYLANGSPDTTFSGDGLVITDFGGTNGDGARAVAAQTDGKVVVAGLTCGLETNCNVALARYTRRGKLDTTFSGDGKVITNYGGRNNDNDATAVALQPDGKILVAGSIFNGTDYDFAIYRYMPNGALDKTFSGDGVSVGNLGTGKDETANDLAIQSDGKIIVIGGTGNSPNHNFAIVRLTANGNLDTSFSQDGFQITNFGGDDVGYGVAVQPNGKIVVVGQKFDNSTFITSMAVVRYNSNGSLDTTFSGTGSRVFSFTPGTDSSAQDVAVQSNGKIVIIGATGISPSYLALVRLNAKGRFDTTFSGNGKMKIDFGGGGSEGTAIAIQLSDGRYVVGGKAFTDGNNQFALARVLP